MLLAATVLFAALAGFDPDSNSYAESPDESSVYESADRQMLLFALNRGEALLVDGVLYDRSGMYRNGAPTQPLYTLADYRWIRAITDDGQFAVLSGTWSLTIAGIGVHRRYHAKDLYEDISVVPRPTDVTWYPWIGGEKFHNHGRRYYLETLEGRLFVFDLTTGAILAVSGDIRPNFSAEVTFVDGAVQRLNRFHKCDSIFSLLQDTQGDSDLGVTGFIPDPAATDPSRQLIIAIPFEKIVTLERVEGDGHSAVFEVATTDGGRTRLAIESFYSYCGKDESDSRAVVSIDRLRRIANLNVVAPVTMPGEKSPEAMREYLEFYKGAGDVTHWTPVAKEGYALFEYRAFTAAAAKGDLDRIREFVALGANPAYYLNYKESPLTVALRKTQFAAAEYMLQAAPRLRFEDDDPVLLEAVKALVEHGTDPSLPTVVRLLVEKDANPNVENRDGETPLTMLVAAGNDELLGILLDKGVDANFKTPLHLAKTPAAVVILTRHGADPNREIRPGVTLFYEKVQQRNPDPAVLEALLQAGADPKRHPQNASTAWDIAIGRKDAALVDLLAKNGVDVNTAEVSGGNPLFTSLKSGDLVMAEALLRNGADANIPDQFGRRPLASAQTAEAVELLVRYDADPNATVELSWTPLEKAMIAEEVEIIEALLQAGADPNLRRDKFGTPLGDAAKFGRLEQVQLLLRYGADPDAPQVHGQRPLHMAATRSSEVVRLLLDAGADPNAVDDNGQTPLDHVCPIFSARYDKAPADHILPEMQRSFELLSKVTKNARSIEECRK
ncbi:MAG TPA: ankyrin repeat domain-containing protein [Gammaproteobacteria bacterium]|nr:ankyrin repeat domain-containing protein [Gammaproteobacteria bacterium]